MASDGGSDRIKRLLDTVHDARANLEARLDDVEAAREEYHLAVRQLHAAGLPLREIADALGMSHQRVHQIITAEKPRVGRVKRAIRSTATGGAALMLMLGLMGGWFANQSLDEPDVRPAREPAASERPKSGRVTGSGLPSFEVFAQKPGTNCPLTTLSRMVVVIGEHGERNVTATLGSKSLRRAMELTLNAHDNWKCSSHKR